MAVPMIYVIVPAIATTWPALLPILLAVTGAMGYGLLHERKFVRRDLKNKGITVELELPNTEVVGESLGTETQMQVAKNDVVITFRVDHRGKCNITVWGQNKLAQELREIGTEISQKIIQQFVYNKVTRELPTKGLTVVSEQRTEQDSIQLTVRRWR
ncbi:MAG: hypothetical protein N3A72_11330 [bacterium]|nr:hypothetical protein [bacterium]